MASPSHERQTWMPAYAITVQIIMTLLLGIRIVSRFRKMGSRFGLDDVFICIGWALGTAGIVLTLLGTYSYGFGHHVWDVPPQLWPKAGLVTWLIVVMFVFGTAFTKVSILLCYRRLEPSICSTPLRYALFAAIAFTACYTITIFILMCAGCIPTEAVWRKVDPTFTESYHCASVELSVSVAELSGALSVISDFYTILLPALLLLRIQISRRQRMGLVAIFGVGFLAVVAGIFRTISLGRIQGNDPDKTWLGYSLFAAGIAESSVGIICACAPSLKSCFRSYFRDHVSELGGTALGRLGVSRGEGHKLGSQSPSGMPRDDRSALGMPVLGEKFWSVDSTRSDEQDRPGMSPGGGNEERLDAATHAMNLGQDATEEGGKISKEDTSWCDMNESRPPSFLYINSSEEEIMHGS